MKKNSMQVGVTLQTTIDDGGERECSTIEQAGVYHRKGDLEVLVFSENRGETDEVRTMISIHPDKVIIKCSGAVSMTQQFMENQTTECLYHHPYGTFHIDLYTNSIRKKGTDHCEGELIIHYEASINGQKPRKHYLTLNYIRE